jgi:hypothetical protein
LIVASGLLALLAALCPGWVGGRGSSNDPLPTIGMGLPAAKEVTIRIRRIRMKKLIIQRLDAGELTLFEAAAAFQQLNSTPEDCQDHAWRRWPGADDGERLCRQVILWAAPSEGLCPGGEQKARREQLERDLREHIAAHGGVKLPTHVPEE